MTMIEFITNLSSMGLMCFHLNSIQYFIQQISNCKIRMNTTEAISMKAFMYPTHKENGQSNTNEMNATLNVVVLFANKTT